MRQPALPTVSSSQMHVQIKHPLAHLQFLIPNSTHCLLVHDSKIVPTGCLFPYFYCDPCLNSKRACKFSTNICTCMGSTWQLGLYSQNLPKDANLIIINS